MSQFVPVAHMQPFCVCVRDVNAAKIDQNVAKMIDTVSTLLRESDAGDTYGDSRFLKEMEIPQC